MKIGIEDIARACVEVGSTTTDGLRGRCRIRELVDLRKVFFRIATLEFGIGQGEVMEYLSRVQCLAYSYRESSEWLYCHDEDFRKMYEKVMTKIKQQ